MVASRPWSPPKPAAVTTGCLHLLHSDPLTISPQTLQKGMFRYRVGNGLGLVNQTVNRGVVLLFNRTGTFSPFDQWGAQKINHISEMKWIRPGPDGDDNDILTVTIDIVPVALATGSFRLALSESGIHRPSTASCHLVLSSFSSFFEAKNTEKVLPIWVKRANQSLG